nr:hypothetical protein [Tanacetum cinerariifolium]
MLQAKENLMEAIQAFLKKQLKLVLNWKPLIFYDDDDEESSIPLRDIISELPLSVAIAPDLPITDSLIMKDEHLNTISDTESNEENQSSVKDLNLTPSESENLSYNEKIISSKIDPLYNEIDSIPQRNDNDHFNAESDLIESLLNQDTLMVSSPKIDSLLEEFSNELAYINLIPAGIDEADFDPKEDICLSFSPSPIHIEDSDYLMEEIDIFLAPDDSIPPVIKNDDYDLEGDNLFLNKLLNNDSLSKNESFHFDRYYVPSSPRPPEKPQDDDGIYFDIEPDMGVLTAKVFNPGILASKKEKSPHFLSHRGFKAFQIIYNFSKSPMMIMERTFLSWMFCFSISILLDQLKIASDYEDSRAHGFILCSLEL